MAREYFCAYHSYLKSIEPLNDAERGRLFTALLEYSSTGAAQNLPGVERVLFPTMKEQIDRDGERYIERCNTNRENVLRRYTNVDERIREPTKPTKKKENSKTSTMSKQSQSTRPFHPPTLEDVEKYCRERNNGVDAKRFYDYYADADWTDQNGKKVRNWKQKIIAVWERTAERSENDAPVERDYTAAPDGMRLLL